MCTIYQVCVYCSPVYNRATVGLPLTLAAVQDGRQTDCLYRSSQPCAKHHRQETSWKVSTPEELQRRL